MLAAVVVAPLVLVSVALASFVVALVKLVFATIVSFAIANPDCVQYQNVIAFAAKPSLVMLQIGATLCTQQTRTSVLAHKRTIETGDWREGRLSVS